MKAMVVVDGSNRSHDVVRFAEELLGEDHDSIVVNTGDPRRPLLVPAGDLPSGPQAGFPGFGEDVPSTTPSRSAAANVRSPAEQAEHYLRSSDLIDGETSTELSPDRFGAEPVGRIVRAAEDHGVDMIIVGQSRLRGLSRLFSRSVDQSLLRNAPCPVLIVR